MLHFNRKLERSSCWESRAEKQIGSLYLSHRSAPHHPLLLSTVNHLYICIESFSALPRWEDDTENSQWLDNLRPFIVVKNVCLSWRIALRLVAALQELVGDSVTSVLPVLECLLVDRLNLSGPLQEAIAQFVAARQLASRPIAVYHWDGVVGFGSDMSLSLPFP